MKQATHDWIKKAESDYRMALTLSRNRKETFHDGVCFHCQQSAEKYLKARLEEDGKRVPRTHDLDELLQALLPVEPLWAALQPAATFLSDYGVDFRYPGNEATAQAAKTALKNAKVVRKEVRLALGLKG